MRHVVLVDGPEKAGKSTFVAALADSVRKSGMYNNVYVRHWGPVKPDDRVYAPFLQSALEGNDGSYLEIWDRGWPSEFVYGTLLDRKRRGAADPWLLEWLHGRAINGRGLKIMYLPSTLYAAATLRDDTDIPVNPQKEFDLYHNYGLRFNYLRLYNRYDTESLTNNVEYTVRKLEEAWRLKTPASPRYFVTESGAGAGWNETLILGEARNPNDYKTLAGAWLPFSSLKMTEFTRKYFGDRALFCSWTNAEDIESGKVPSKVLSYAYQVIALGAKAQKLAISLNLKRVHCFAHPAYFARWNTDRGRASLVEFEEKFAAIKSSL